MTPVVTFTVYGIPAPKGSTKAFMPHGARFPVVTEDNAHTRPWAALVKDAALRAVGDGPMPFLGVPVALRFVFWLPRPVSLPKKVVAPIRKPDLDKLSRCVGDALTGVLWHDDACIVAEELVKAYCRPGERPRLVATVREATPELQSWLAWQPATSNSTAGVEVQP